VVRKNSKKGYIMKKIVIITSIILASSTLSAEVHRNTGCGLGSMIIENQNTVAKQILAATSNGTSGNQTFGITSGSLNCDQPIKLILNEKIERFVRDNIDEIALDISVGEGENLDTLSTLLDIKDAEKFKRTLQDNFSKIYTDDSVTSAQVIDNIMTIIG
jgi:hypothetical protein